MNYLKSYQAAIFGADVEVQSRHWESAGLKFLALPSGEKEPSLEILLQSAQELGAQPENTVIFEDSLAGIKAARLGNFGLVVGIKDKFSARELKEEGADLVISHSSDLENALGDPDFFGAKPALDHLDEISTKIPSDHHLAFFLDYDGTLSPIVKNPKDAILSEEMKDVLRSLVRNFSVTIISGRDRLDVEKLVGIGDINHVGCHGFDTQLANGSRNSLPNLQKTESEIGEAEKFLIEKIKPIRGALVERKRFTITVHYRNVSPNDLHILDETINMVVSKFGTLRRAGGKKVFELRPKLDWHKGKALLWVWDQIQQNSKHPFSIFLGDDLTDEDAFEAIENIGIGILVGKPTFESKAHYYLNEQSDVKKLLLILGAEATQTE